MGLASCVCAGAVGGVAWLIRHTLAAAAPARDAVSGASLWPYRGALLWGTLLITGSTTSVYLILNFLPVFLTEQQGWPKVIGQSAVLVASLVILLGSPLLGHLADRLPQRIQLIRPALLLGMVLAPVLFGLILSGQIRWLLLPLVALFMLTTVAQTVSGLTLIMECFPVGCRTLAMGICYSLGVTLFGGFSAALVLKLMALTGSPWVPVGYLLLALVVSWLAAGRLSTAARTSFRWQLA